MSTHIVTRELAPIALFVYKRLDHLQEVISSLLKNDLAKKTDIYIFSDGPKNVEVEKSILAVREWLKSIIGFKSITVIIREKNMGLAQSIIQGVTELINQFKKVIVLEDDIVVSPYFLDYMNQGLDLYEHDPQVASIHAYTLPVKGPLPETFFLRGADCWGWATWQRAWHHFEPNGSKLLKSLETQNLTKLFDFNGSHPYTKMLKDQIGGKFNSWAIRWHASAFLLNMLTLYPGKSLVQNIGLDNTGEHCPATSIMDVSMSSTKVTLERIPFEVSSNVMQAYIQYFKDIKGPFLKRAVNRLSRIYRKYVTC